MSSNSLLTTGTGKSPESLDKIGKGAETPKDGEVSVSEEEKEELSKPYVDKRSCILSIVSNYSAFRRRNLGALGNKKEVIGSSITSSRILSSYTPEIESYFPAIIGLSPTNPDFIRRVKEYLSNIKITVTTSDLRLNNSFIYNTKKDYLDFKKKEDAINNAYDAVDKSNLEVLRKACNVKCNALNDIERTKYQVGSPEDIHQYLMYRHCLLYSEVAKDMAFINSNSMLRVYIKDENKEIARRESVIKELKIAMNNFAKIANSDIEIETIFIQVAIDEGRILSEALNMNIISKTSAIMSYLNVNPKKLNSFIKDEHRATKALIERLIIIGELSREVYNQRITTSEGSRIGANLDEAVSYFEDENNAGIVNSYKKKLQLFKQ